MAITKEIKASGAAFRCRASFGNVASPASLPHVYKILSCFFVLSLMQLRVTACTSDDCTAQSFLTNVVKFDLIPFFCHFFLWGKRECRMDDLK